MSTTFVTFINHFKKIRFFAVLIIYAFLPGVLFAQAPTLGTYPNTTIISGTNSVITPNAVPVNTLRTVAYTNSNFTGTFIVNPVTGVLIVTNAKQAGTYSVTIKAFGSGVQTATSTFILTVSNPNCSQGTFTGTTNYNVGTLLGSIAIGDFNNDSKQDFAIANYSYNYVSVFLGNGNGTFIGGTGVAVGAFPTGVAAGDFNGDGKLDIVAANNNANTVSIRLGNGTGGFTGNTDLVVAPNAQPLAVSTGDFNGDGKLDIAIANGPSTSTISIRLGDGLGNFTGNTNVVVGSNPRMVAVGDFNGDGNQDIATPNASDNNVSIRMGNGAGGFSSTNNIAVGVSPYSVALGDFNNDGNQDFAVTNSNINNVSIKLGDGTGGFTGNTNIAVGNHPFTVAVGDFNGDGNKDIAVSNDNSSTISILTGNGSGTFNLNATLAVGTYPHFFSVGDFNADGKHDMVIANDFLGKVTIRMGSGPEINVKGNNISISDGDVTPSFNDNTNFGNVLTSASKQFIIENTGSVALTIPNGGITITGPDAAMFDVTGPNAAQTINPGSTAVISIEFIPASSGIKTATLHIASSDCNETDYDFAIQGNGVGPTLGTYSNRTLISGSNTTIIPNTPPLNAYKISAYSNSSFSGTFFVNASTGILTVTNAKHAGTFPVTVLATSNGGLTATTSFVLTVQNPICSDGTLIGNTELSMASSPKSTAIGDFNNDGKQDLAVAVYGNNTVSLMLGNGSGNFSLSANVNVGTGPYSVAAIDFNGDGKMDIAAANYSASTISIRFGDGNGNFIPSIPDVSVGSGPMYIVAGDFNNDGSQDIATANSNSNNVTVKLGNGNASFGATTTIAVGTTPQSIATGDFNGDGNLDFATANYGSTYSVRLGDGAGGFTGSSNINIGGNPVSVAVGDFNNNGIQDLAISRTNSTQTAIRLGDGLGGFNGSTEVASSAYPVSIATGDFNGDGNQDITTANFFGSYSVSLGNGSGSFTTGANPAIGQFPNCVVVGDFNADGRHDIAISADNVNKIYIRLGTGPEINLTGNNISIADGDVIPATADFSDFGILNMSLSLTRTFVIQNTSTTPLSISSISMSGTDAALFTVGNLTPASPIPAGSSATFTLTFSPGSQGLKSAAVTISNDDCDEPAYDFAVQGTGSNCTNSTDPLSATCNAPYNQVCQGSTVSLTVNGGSLGIGASWKWYEGGCANGNLIGTGSTISITPSSLGDHQYCVRAEGPCGNTACQCTTVNVISTSPVGGLHFTAYVEVACVGTTATFSVNNLPSCKYYNWTCDQSGVVLNGNTSPYQTTSSTIQVTFNALPAAGASGWSICVNGGNACGSTTRICFWVRAKLNAPSPLTGNKFPCANTSVTYCIPGTGVSGASSYLWTVTGDADINGIASSITTPSNVQCVTVNFHTGWTSGTLCVFGQNACGFNGPSRCITLTSGVALPGNITGPSYVCPLTSSIFSIATVANACAYEWSCSVPGCFITPNGTTCAIGLPATIPAGSQICVRAFSCCGVAGPWKCRGIAGGAPNIPSAIQGSQYGMCCETGVSYFINPNLTPPATAYKWTISGTGASIIGPDYLSGVTIDFDCPFNSVVLCVRAINGCGSSNDRCLTIYGKPQALCPISGPTSVCYGDIATYCTCSINNVNSYVWSIPPGANIISGQNSVCITVQWGMMSGNITVAGSNPCGNTALKILPVSVVCRQAQILNSKILSFEVYPNPVTNKATVKFTSADAAQYHLNMTDVLGQNVMSKDGAATEGINMVELNLGSVAKGIYVLSFTSNENTQQIKVVVE